MTKTAPWAGESPEKRLGILEFFGFALDFEFKDSRQILRLSGGARFAVKLYFFGSGGKTAAKFLCESWRRQRRQKPVRILRILGENPHPANP